MKEARFQKLSDRIPVFLAGATAGILLAWLFSNGRSRSAGEQNAASPEGESADPERGRWSDALGGAVEGLRGVRDRKVRDAERIDIELLRSELQTVVGSEQIQLRELGGGIVEALGGAPDAETVQRVLAVLRQGAGVSVVVNRIWTPSSAAERKADIFYTPRERPSGSSN